MQFPHIDPVFLSIGPLQFRWYGLMYVLSFIATYFIIRSEVTRKKLSLTKDDVADLVFYGAMGVVLGGRTGYILFYNLGFYLANPLKLFAVWEGGMSFHGGFLGVLLAFWLYARRKKIPFLTLIDMAALCAPVGLGLGRIGNFINGELYGRATDSAWGMVFPGSDGVPRHPSQLYEAFLEGLVLFFIVRLVSRHTRRGRRYDVHRLSPGTDCSVLSWNSFVSLMPRSGCSSTCFPWGSCSVCRCSSPEPLQPCCCHAARHRTDYSSYSGKSRTLRYSVRKTTGRVTNMISKKMSDSLNTHMNLELFSAHLYLVMSSCANDLGLKGAANWFFVQYREEMIHFMKFYTYLSDQGVVISMPASKEVPNKYKSLLDMMQKTLAHEQLITSCINNLSEQAVQEKDHATQIFLQWFVTEQIEEENNDRDLIAKLKLVGDNGPRHFDDRRRNGQRTFVVPAGSPLAGVAACR